VLLRTEPALACRVLLALHTKYRGSAALDVTWVVKLVLQDLLDWQAWTIKARVLQPLGLLVHGEARSCVSIFLDKNRHYIGKSQSKIPPKTCSRRL
jgi:hypothetical protein